MDLILIPGSPLIPCLPCEPGGPITPCSPSLPFAPFDPRFPRGPGSPFGPGGPGTQTLFGERQNDFVIIDLTYFLIPARKPYTVLVLLLFKLRREIFGSSKSTTREGN